MRAPRRADLITVAVSVLFASLELVVTTSPAQAAQVCTNDTNHFDGFYHNNAVWPQYNWEGASAYITIRYPGECSGGFRPYTNAWVMIAANTSQPGHPGYAQAGYVRDIVDPNRTEQFKTFAEFANDVNGDGVLDTSPGSPEWERRYWQDAVAGTTPAYRMLWNPSTGKLDASFNGYVYSSSRFNPYNSAWQQPFSPQFMGETRYETGNMPGIPTVRTHFTALGAQRASDHALVSMSCSMYGSNQNTALWGLQAFNCTAFDIWMK